MHFVIRTKQPKILLSAELSCVTDEDRNEFSKINIVTLLEGV